MRHLGCSSTVRRAWEGACRREKWQLPLRTGWSPDRIHFMLWRDIFGLFTNVPLFLNFPLFDQLPGQMWSMVQQQLNTCGLPCVGGKVECDPHYPPCLPRPVPGQAWSPGRLCARCRLPGGSAMASYTFSSSCSSPCVFSFYQMVGTVSVWKAGTSRMASYFEKGEKGWIILVHDVGIFVFVWNKESLNISKDLWYLSEKVKFISKLYICTLFGWHNL